MKQFEKPAFKTATYDLDSFHGKFVMEPLERGFGITLGNALRRVLLSSLPGASVYAIQVDGARHEFSALDGVEEDVTTIILNIKDLVLKITSEDDDTPKLLTIDVKGPKQLQQLIFNSQVMSKLLIRISLLLMLPKAVALRWSFMPVKAEDLSQAKETSALPNSHSEQSQPIVPILQSLRLTMKLNLHVLVTIQIMIV